MNSSRLSRVLALSTVLAVAAVAPAQGATTPALKVRSATTDAIRYTVGPLPAGQYTARFSTSMKGTGPRAVFRFADHGAKGHTWKGHFLGGRRGLKLCIAQSSAGVLVDAPAWNAVCSPVLSPRKTSRPLADALKVSVKRKKVSLGSLKPLAGRFARVTLSINRSPKAKVSSPRKASRGVKLAAGKTVYTPNLRPGESLRSVRIKLEDDYHRYAVTVKR